MQKLLNLLFLTNLIFSAGISFSKGYVKVDNNLVCMVNDMYFGQPQIPVTVDSKTYYGCCEGCKKKLAEDKTLRFTTDPATGETVDKAGAYIVKKEDGSVLYFKKEENYKKYATTKK